MNCADSLNLKIVYRDVESLKHYAKNARKHSAHQIRQIARSIQNFGFANPVLVDPQLGVIAGHARLGAAKLLGLREVPTIQLGNLTPDQVRALIIADNKLAENAKWDEPVLAIELQHLLALDPNFDVTLTGFEIPEIDLVLQRNALPPQQEDTFDPPKQHSVTEIGDLWELGKHRLLCANSLDSSSYATVTANRLVKVAFIDPPYNLRIKDNVSGKGLVQHDDFVMASGEMSKDQFTSFLTSSLENAARSSAVGSVHFICTDWRHLGELLLAGEKAYDTLLNVCVWSKDKGGQGSLYRSAHEFVFVYRNGKSRHRNNIQLGKFGRYRTNIWSYPSVGTLSRQGDEGNLLAYHPTVKPVALVADALLDCSGRGDLVLDSFLGSGTTLIAAERVGRVCFGIELDPRYVDVAIRRWQKHTGNDAVHATSGRTFSEISSVMEADGVRSR
jgi:DNA modification methylase